ncbi:MAG: hypothetical protein H8D56_10050 [Planctomycetes bacterium]|nr:hypothetical protein [Planctomycetota bacterium]MBL7143572.1 hypothetical protein [Phycisphaerae bacterium]
MKSIIKSRAYLSVINIVILLIAGFSVFSSRAYGYSPAMRQGMLSGPWEIVVQMGMDGSMMRFPVKVPNENKATILDNVLPLMGSPIKIRLMQYLPDLKWETSIVEDPKGGAVVQIKAKGENLNQDIWLSSADPAKQSISSQIGGIKIVKLHSSEEIEKIMRELTSSKSIGIVSVWDKNTNKPLEYVANTGDTITLPTSDYKLKILEYVPHYSIDTTTKNVTNMSNKPVNPAIKINLDNGNDNYEQWLWSKFPSSPHMKKDLPLRVQFTDFDIGTTPGNYVFVTTQGSEPWLFYSRDGKKHAEKAKLKNEYPFAQKTYTFSIEDFSNRANIKNEWKKGSEELISPAIIANIVENKTRKQLVLELNKPNHHKSASGTMVLLYRREEASSKAAN